MPRTGPAQNASEVPTEHVQVMKVLAGVENLALLQEGKGFTRKRVRWPNLGTEMRFRRFNLDFGVYRDVFDSISRHRRSLTSAASPAHHLSASSRI